MANIYCGLVFILSGLHYVQSQICNTTKIEWYSHTEIRRISLYETYYDLCGSTTCVKNRLNWTYKPVMTRTFGPHEVSECCPGYIEDNSSDVNDSLRCKAICKVRCKNGYCDKPNICSCHEGYRKKRYWDGIVCEPVCNDCADGKCVDPDKCECNRGYSLNGTCQPICFNPCENGKCVAPETCECLPGYRKSKMDICEPYCSTGCENGECISPETCRCSSGWIKANNSLNVETCMAVCDEVCLNVTNCVAPDPCICKPGYVKTGRNNCLFNCSECQDGKCDVGLEKCVCPGWLMNENRTDCKFIGIETTTETTPEFTEDVTVNIDFTSDANVNTSFEFVWDHTDDIYTTSSSEKSIKETEVSKKYENHTSMYIVMCVCVSLFFVCVILLAVYRKQIVRNFIGGEYTVQDENKESSVRFQKNL